MSVIYGEADCCLVSHKKFINKIYENNVHFQDDPSEPNNDDNLKSLEIKEEVFKLNLPYSRNQPVTEEPSHLKESSRKRRKLSKNQKKNPNNGELDTFIQKISSKTTAFIKKCHEKEYLLDKEDVTESSAMQSITNSEMKSFLNEFDATDEKLDIKKFNGRNALSHSIITSISNLKFVIPPNSAFYNCDVRTMSDLKLDDFYDLIILDPPWWNKFIRRSRAFNSDSSYDMLSNRDILELPIDRFVKPNVSLVVIWCTNAPSLHRLVIEELLPKWNLKLLANWYWIKITNYGESICEFGMPLQKQPFEKIYIACHAESNESVFNCLEPEKYVFSVPSAIHSHKPPLVDLLTKHLPASEQMKCLEIFARYLLPNFTSIGLEVLKLQNLNLFRNVLINKRNAY